MQSYDQPPSQRAVVRRVELLTELLAELLRHTRNTHDTERLRELDDALQRECASPLLHVTADTRLG